MVYSQNAPVCVEKQQINGITHSESMDSTTGLDQQSRRVWQYCGAKQTAQSLPERASNGQMLDPEYTTRWLMPDVRHCADRRTGYRFGSVYGRAHRVRVALPAKANRCPIHSNPSLINVEAIGNARTMNVHGKMHNTSGAIILTGARSARCSASRYRRSRT